MGGLPIRSEKRLPLANLDPKELEDLCAAVLAAEGHHGVRHWGDAGAERGVDVWSVDADGRRWATQCKRTRVGPEDAARERRTWRAARSTSTASSCRCRGGRRASRPSSTWP